MQFRPLEQPRHDTFSKATALVARQHGDIAQVGAVATIGENPTRGNQLAVLERETAKHAVGEDEFKVCRFLVSEWRSPIKGGELFPVDAIQAFAPQN